MTTLTLVVPVYNEAEVIPLLAARLRAVFSAENCAQAGLGGVDYLFIDDGSRDATVLVIGQHFALGEEAKVVRFSRNFGHQAAVSAGLIFAEGDLVAIIDADLQDPPEVIFRMVEKWRE